MCNGAKPKRIPCAFISDKKKLVQFIFHRHLAKGERLLSTETDYNTYEGGEMSRIQLKIQGVTDVAAMPSTSLIIITDTEEKRQIASVCNENIRREFAIRYLKYNGSESKKEKTKEELKTAMPETVCTIFKEMTELELAVVIVGIYDGQYQAVIENSSNGNALPIDINGALLLCYAAPELPLYIEETVWIRQSVPYLGTQAQGVALPLNTLSMEMLKEALERCIKDERYEMAKQLKDEINRREK